MATENKVSNPKQPNKAVQNFKVWWNDKALPTFTKIGNQRHLSAIRDAFGTMIPLIIAGGIGMLIDAIIFGGAGSGKVSLLGLFAKAGHSWDEVDAMLAGTGKWAGSSWNIASTVGASAFGQIQIATIGAMSLYFSFLLGYFLSLSRGFKNPVLAGLASFACFIIASMGKVEFFMDTKGLFTALVVGIIATELFVWFGNMKALEVKLPSGVPPAVGKSFAVFLPMVFTTGIVAIINIIFLAPALTHSDAGLYVNSYSYMVSSENLWNASLGMSNDGFLEFASKTYGVNDLNSFLVDPANTAYWDELFTNFGTGNIEAWAANVQANLTDNGQAALAEYMLHLAALDTAGTVEGLSHNVGSFFTSTQDGMNQLIVSLRYSVISVDATGFGLGAAIYKFFTSWFISFATGDGGLGLAVCYTFFISFFWFFGVHGSNIMGAIFEPIWWMILGVNTALIASGLPKDMGSNPDLGVFAKPMFDIYMNIGGSGATLGLLILVMFFSRRRELKEVSKYALPAGCFNINEPVIFGFPLVLNAVYIVPFIFSPMVAMIIGWLFTDPMNAVNVVYVTVPWTAPWILGAILATTDPMALLVALICFAVSTAIWFPFILLDNIVYLNKLKKTDPEKYEEEYKYVHDKAYRKEYNAKAKAERLEEKKLAKEERANEKAAKLEAKQNKVKAKDQAEA